MHIQDILITIIIVSAYVVSVSTGMLLSEYNTEMSQPYYEGIYIDDGMESWDRELVNITVSGNPSPYDWYCIEDVINEWNTKVSRPKIGYSDAYGDIEINFDRHEDDEWAGATWATVYNKTLLHAYIEVRTSWPFNREHVIRHELGHAMGLCYHSNHPDSTMYKWASGVGQWSQEDIDIITQLYNGNRYPTVD